MSRRELTMSERCERTFNPNWKDPRGPVEPRGVSDAEAERFCALVNWAPDGEEWKAVEGEMRGVTFRELAKGYIRAADAARGRG